MYAWEKNPDISNVDAYELYLFIQNDADLDRQQATPIIKNLVAKKARGVYQSGPAAKLYGYLAENGAKKYYAENVEGKYGRGAFPQNVGSGWHEMFSKKLRDAVSEELRDSFEEEYALGNYNQFIPKKYQPKYKPVAKQRSKRRSSGTSLGTTR